MFGNVIYYDKNKIDEYRAVVKGQKNLQIDEYEVSNDKGVQIDLKAFGADAKASKTYRAKVQESLLYNCDEFEKMLMRRDDFFDFTQSEDYDLTTMSRGTIIKFDGYMSVYMSDEDEKSDAFTFSQITKESQISLDKYDNKQHFTQPPAHYTEASLVKTLEELGIGRPSTYAPTIGTIIARRYVIKEDKNLYVTEIGEAVNKIMLKSFPSIVDVNFTANMESLLDKVEEGSVNWKTVVRNFYPDLDAAVKLAEKELETVKIEDEVTDVICENCGRNMVIKYGPHGKFLACPGFPECRNTKPYLEKIGVACPKCGKEVILLRTRKGRKYYGCENSECDFMSWNKPSSEKCPKCGGYMVEKGNKLACANEQCGYVTNYVHNKENN